MLHAVPVLSVVLVTFFECIEAVAMEEILEKGTLIALSVRPGVLALAVFETVDILTFEARFVRPSLLAQPMLHVVLPEADIHGAISVLIAAITVCSAAL